MEARYKTLLRCIDHLASTKMYEIGPCDHGIYEKVAAASLKVECPKCLECNFDVHCLAVGADRYYLLPDCVLIFVDKNFYASSYSKVSLAINSVRGSLKSTVTDYRWMHARVDGGPDRRYKYNYQIPVPRKVLVPLDQYGILTFRIARDEFLILTDGPQVLSNFEAAFQNWLKIQR